ncbi:uncharacterized protein LOC120012199 isoform X1 [Tripterygium wilfordii]|uniref:uncharacterized protein LOC120012199 isoform X1 n=1 Tax=Tripterygium wilfordii TaxID=458696 RepID=UPI0018F8117C|nr:uncharacterized protein LOC120012199 isoform X1 [Tripterygium wilfordii]
MSNEEEAEVRRLYQCARKYERIVKQFDELIEILDNRTRPPKRRRVLSSSCSRGSGSSCAPVSSSQPDNNEVFVQTISRLLRELRANSATDDPDCSTSNGDDK